MIILFFFYTLASLGAYFGIIEPLLAARNATKKWQRFCEYWNKYQPKPADNDAYNKLKFDLWKTFEE
jgi:hypothetical protein